LSYLLVRVWLVDLKPMFFFFDSIAGDFVARLMHTRYAPPHSIGNHEGEPEITKSVKCS